MEHAADSIPVESFSQGITRTILADLPRVAVAGLPEGVVAILRRTVIDAGLDIQDVRQLLWSSNGGFESETYLRLVREDSGPLNPLPYFAFPLTALAPPS